MVAFLVCLAEDGNWSGHYNKEYTVLTYYGLNKMADNLQTTFLKNIFFNKNDDIFIQIPLRFVSKGPLENMSPQV